MESSVASEMVMPPTFTARASGFRHRPSQFAFGDGLAGHFIPRPVAVGFPPAAFQMGITPSKGFSTS